MKQITLGLHVSHNSSACLFVNGKLIAAIQEERLRRIKQYEGFPLLSINFVLHQANIKPSEVDNIAIAGIHQNSENPYFVYDKTASVKNKFASTSSKIGAGLKGRIPLNFLDKIIYPKQKYLKYIKSELELLGFDLNKSQVNYFDHHLCHAASAYFQSGYTKAIVLTQDGRGDFLSGTCYIGGEDLKKVYLQASNASLAQLYAGVTKYLGFTPLKHEGKITGLAAFGKDTALNVKIQDLFEILDSGELRRKVDFKEFDRQLSSIERKIINASNSNYKEFTKFGFLFQKWLKKHADGMNREDVAFAIQDATEKVVLNSLKQTLDKLKIKEPINICVAGGIFANVKLNQRIKESSPLVNRVFVQPAMGDEGLALGAAILTMNLNKIKCEKIENVYWGNGYSDTDIEEELKKWSDKFSYDKYDNVEQKIALHLNDGKVIGRFNGRMEFGPRALGNRSILIHPANKDVNDIVNKRLKRTEFMPFAPSVLDYRAKDYFVQFDNKDLTAERMTITYDVFAERVKEIDAVVHVDITARPQIVTEETNASFYKILEEFNKISGVGCVVNTSFNMHEEPIVSSPYDALRAFEQGCIDYLAIGNFIVYPKK